MCIAALAFAAHPRWALVVAANRDEFHARPALPLARWADAPQIIAGRDAEAGGTWLGLTEAGRLTLVTNFRVDGFPRPDHAIPPARFAGYRMLTAQILVARQRMAYHNSVIAFGV